MSRTRYLVAALATLVVVGLVAVGGLAVHRLGWSQGYEVGRLAAGGEETAGAAYAPYGSVHSGLLLTVGLILLGLLIAAKLVRVWAWRTMAWPWMMARAPVGRHWTRHWHGPYGPMPPWWWQSPPEQEGWRAQPPEEGGAA